MVEGFSKVMVTRGDQWLYMGGRVYGSYWSVDDLMVYVVGSFIDC